MSPNARAYYAADIAQFASSSVAAILGNLAANTNFDIELAQRNAWSEQIPILKTALLGIEGSIFLEFVVPRIGSRIDAVLVSGPVLFVIEFKVGAEAFSRDDLNQVWDYALDLKNFHRESHAAAIVPILVATHASRSDVVLSEPYSDGVYPPVTSNRDGLSHLLVEGLRSVKGTPIDAVAWSRSPYQPTPTIIEAARALYSRHSIEDISRHDAGARNLRVTSQRIDELIEEARNTRTKTIVFVTGVPGAGKSRTGRHILHSVLADRSGRLGSSSKTSMMRVGHVGSEEASSTEQLQCPPQHASWRVTRHFGGPPIADYFAIGLENSAEIAPWRSGVGEYLHICWRQDSCVASCVGFDGERFIVF
jgi:hypothetical protein